MNLDVLFRPPLFSALSFESGKWVVIAEFDTPIMAILFDGDTGKTIIKTMAKVGDEAKSSYKTEVIDGVMSLKTLFWPKRQLDFKLHISNLLTKGKGLSYDKFDSVKEFANSKYVIGDRVVYTDYLREREVHPCIIQFLTDDGGSFVIIVNITTKVFNPIPAIQLEDFLGLINGKVAEQIGNWGRQKNFDDLQKINVNETKKETNGIFVKNEDGKDEFYIDYINRDIKEIGVSIDGIDIVDKFPADESSDLVQSKKQVVDARYKDEAAEYQKNARLKLNNAKDTENKTEAEFVKKKADAIAEAQVKIIQAQAEANKALATGNIQYLSQGNQNNPVDLGTLLYTQKKGGSDAKDS